MLETSVGSIESAALHDNEIPRSEYFIILLTIKFGSSHSIVVGLLIRMLLKLHISVKIFYQSKQKIHFRHFRGCLI